MTLNTKRYGKIIFILFVFLIPLIFTAIWCPLTYRVAPQTTLTLKVMTYNIHEGVDVNNRLNLDPILASIQQWDPDVLVLQEVDTACIFSGSVDQSRWFALKLNMFLAPITSLDHIWQSDALLSKYPITDYESIIMESPGEDDTLLKVTLDVDGQSITILVSHLTAMSSADRRIQADIALPYIAAISGPKIWAGDFNVNAYTNDTIDQGIYSDILTYFNDSFNVADTCIGNLTWPSLDPVERIDYIFVSPEIDVASHRVVESLASDHLPVIAEIKLPI
jgi:endonuclease/exonuclease/phosphatase family metal-dependent hydrolase